MATPKRKLDDRHLRLLYKGGRCAVCGLSIQAVERRFMTSKCTFEFNHIDPSQKSPSYEKLMKRVPSTAQFDELDKCNLLCRVCHGVWTNQRLKGTITLPIVTPNGRVESHSIPFHGILELRRGSHISTHSATHPAISMPTVINSERVRVAFCSGLS